MSYLSIFVDQDMTLEQVKTEIVKEIMEYHEPKKPMNLGKFNLKPVVMTPAVPKSQGKCSS